MTSKYPTWSTVHAPVLPVVGLLVCLLVVASCGPAPAVSGPGTPASPVSPGASRASAGGSSSAPASPSGLGGLIPATVTTDRQWYTLPDGLATPTVIVRATFASDPAAGAPAAAIGERGTPVSLQRDGTAWTASLPLTGVAPGTYEVRILERIGTAAEIAGRAVVRISAPEYVVWTLDFEGDASGDPELTNAAAIADGLHVPMVVFWNPRAWTTDQVSRERQDAMLAWTTGRLAKGDEVALHLHLWTDYVRAAGLIPRLQPSWAGRGDGYDVPLTAYPEEDQRTLIAYGSRLMVEHGLPRPTSFRAGGDIGDAATLRAAAAAGFTVDCTAVPQSAPPIGRIPFPWTLARDAQPYFPSRTDANVPGDLPLLESPTIGPNTYAATVGSIQPYVRAAQALFAPAGQIATERRTIDLVSHPGTIVPAERAAIELYLHTFDALRYDADRGPVRFVTLQDLAKAYSR